MFKNDSIDIILDIESIDRLNCGDSSSLNIASFLNQCQRILRVSGSFTTTNEINLDFHFKRSHLGIELKIHNNEDSNKSIYHLTKLPYANEISARNWNNVKYDLEWEHDR